MENEASRYSSADVIIVGGGLAGLSAAALLARAGRSVIVIEQAGRLGGRACTHVRDEVHWNLGPHALYCAGHAFRLLEELGVPFRGRLPNPGRGMLVRGGSCFPLPTGLGSLIGTRLLTIREKWQFARLLMSRAKLDTRPLHGVTLRQWLDQTVGQTNLAAVLIALVRLSTYCDEPERMSAGAALDQVKLALAGNVWYLDGGWQTIVDGLRDQAAAHGAEFRTRARVDAVHCDEGGVTVRLAQGEEIYARAAILAIDPEQACKLLDEPASSPLACSANRSVPVQAASLDLALSRLSQPETRFALGLDRPYYYSVHSAAARLAPDGVAVVHVMKYVGTDGSASAQSVEHELESFLEALQPGWKEHVVARRFLPSLTVAHSVPFAHDQGLLGRPGVALPAHPYVFLAGDWVGPLGMLADASAASAAESARRVLTILEGAPAVERGPIHAAS